jgi:hypothetical protein
VEWRFNNDSNKLKSIQRVNSYFNDFDKEAFLYVATFIFFDNSYRADEVCIEFINEMGYKISTPITCEKSSM